MKFTKAGALLLALSVLLGACSSTPGSKKSKAKPDEAQGPVAAAGASILPPGPALPNPYLQNKTGASRQAQQQFAEATRAMRNKQWGQAQSLLQKLVAENPKLSGAHLNLGLVYRAQNQADLAAQSFKAAIEANHLNLDAYNALALLQREQGEFTAAEANYTKALSLWPWYPEGHKNLAILYDLYMGKHPEALAHYEAYQQLAGEGDKQINSWIADLQRRLGITPKPKAAPAPAPVVEADTETEAESAESAAAAEVVDEESSDETQ